MVLVWGKGESNPCETDPECSLQEGLLYRKKDFATAIPQLGMKLSNHSSPLQSSFLI